MFGLRVLSAKKINQSRLGHKNDDDEGLEKM